MDPSFGPRRAGNLAVEHDQRRLVFGRFNGTRAGVRASLWRHSASDRWRDGTSATAYPSYGVFWWSLALFLLFLHGKVPAAFIGWYLFLWAFYMWLATFRSPRVFTPV
jgi:succinate-acetate transporter protein